METNVLSMNYNKVNRNSNFIHLVITVTIRVELDSKTKRVLTRLLERIIYLAKLVVEIN